jgi:hypothetical protein
MFLIVSKIVNIPKTQLPPPKPTPIEIISIPILTIHKGILKYVDKFGANVFLIPGIELVRINIIDRIVFNGINFLRNAAAFVIERAWTIIMVIKYNPTKPNGTVHHQFQLPRNDIILVSKLPKFINVEINPLFLFGK